MTVVCPACPPGLADAGPTQDAVTGGILISLPTIHCAACISKIESALFNVNGVAHARVNLGLKRVRVTTVPGIETDTLLEAITAAGFEARALDTASLGSQDDPDGRDLLLRLAVAGFAMMNVMLLSVAVWSGATAATRDMFHLISALIAVPAVLYSGQPFYRNALSALRVHRLNMDVPVSLAILLAAGMSLFETLQGGEHAYFDAALSLTFFLLIGRFLDHRTRTAARSAAKELAALEVENVTRLGENGQETIAAEALNIGDIILVQAGMRVPADGMLLKGSSEIDRSFLTGESRPVQTHMGQELAAGEVNLTAPLEIRVTATGVDTALRKMAAMVEAAETARNSYSGLADQAARIYAPLVHILAALAFAGWLIYSGDVRLSLNIAIAVLIITCPCALGLAVPAVATAAAGSLFRKGVLIKNATALERLAEVDSVIFDKTGTLTLGQAVINDTLSPKDLRLLKSLASASSHPKSRSIARALDGIDPLDLKDIQEHPGRGISATYDDETLFLGRIQNHPGISFQRRDSAPMQIDIHEQLRPGVEDAIRDLQGMGQHISMLTGDDGTAAHDIAERLHLSDVSATQRPQDKLDKIAALQAKGCKPLMIGDGINDTAAMAAAYASIAPATALDAPRATADVVILAESFHDLATILKIAKSARARILENFTMAALYNLIAVPLALAGFATPLMAAIAMSLSSLTVLLNALRLRST